MIKSVRGQSFRVLAKELSYPRYAWGAIELGSIEPHAEHKRFEEGGGGSTKRIAILQPQVLCLRNLHRQNPRHQRRGSAKGSLERFHAEAQRGASQDSWENLYMYVLY